MFDDEEQKKARAGKVIGAPISIVPSPGVLNDVPEFADRIEVMFVCSKDHTPCPMILTSENPHTLRAHEDEKAPPVLFAIPLLCPRCNRKTTAAFLDREGMGLPPDFGERT